MLIKRFYSTSRFIAPFLVVHQLLCPSFLIMANETKKDQSEKTVIVIGGGLAGLSAAVEVAKNRAKLILIEGQRSTGGNSAKATSGINGCETETQHLHKIKDSHDLFFSDTLKAGHNENDQELVDLLVHNSADAIKFLTDMNIDLTNINIGGGHSVPRTHCFPTSKDGKLKPFGVTLMRSVYAKLAEYKSSLEAISLPDRMQILTETQAEKLLTAQKDGKTVVTGVQIRGSDGQSRDLLADAVVLASGGYCNDHSPEGSLLAEYAGERIKFPTTNGPWADGSGIKMARKIGAELIDMQKLQIHPTGFVDPADPKAKTKFLAAEALRGAGAILLNAEGRRFANELGLRDYLTGEILKRCPINETSGTLAAFIILNDEAVEKFDRPSFNFYWKTKKFFKLAANVAELSELTEMPLENVKSTLNQYNGHVNKAGSVDEFGKKVFPVAFQLDQQFYVGTITPVLHYSMGGLKINRNAQVLSSAADHTPIPGLFAAGEVTGGVHGGNRLSGNSLLECVVFGRIAGTNAVLSEEDAGKADL